MSATTLSPTAAQPIVSNTRVGDPITGLYNTTADESTGGYNGMYSSPSETPPYAIDGLVSTKYLNYGSTGSIGAVVYQPGAGTGFYITPTVSNVSVACALLFATANDNPQRDPLTVTMEGTNVTATAALNLGSSWTLIYSGSTGLDPTIAPNRTTYGIQQNFSNTIPYSSYRLLVTSQRANSCCTQYSEVQIMGYV